MNEIKQVIGENRIWLIYIILGMMDYKKKKKKNEKSRGPKSEKTVGGIFLSKLVR